MCIRDRCNTGRLGAQGLYNISTPVSDPQPGDLVFFVGTYDLSLIHISMCIRDRCWWRASP